MKNKRINNRDNIISLKNENEFDLLFSKGRVIISDDQKIKARYLIKNDNIKKKIKIGLSVNSKKGNSVWRNRIKRILREAIRVNKKVLQDVEEQIENTLLIIFSPHSIDQTKYKKIFLNDIQKSVLDTLLKLKKKILPAN